MLGVIRREDALSKLFTETPNIVEVFADKDFQLDNNSAVFYFLTKGKLNIIKVFSQMLKIYDDKFKFYVATNSQDIMLENKKLIWRKGVWYL